MNHAETVREIALEIALIVQIPTVILIQILMSANAIQHSITSDQDKLMIANAQAIHLKVGVYVYAMLPDMIQIQIQMLLHAFSVRPIVMNVHQQLCALNAVLLTFYYLMIVINPVQMALMEIVRQSRLLVNLV